MFTHIFFVYIRMRCQLQRAVSLHNLYSPALYPRFLSTVASVDLSQVLVGEEIQSIFESTCTNAHEVSANVARSSTQFERHMTIDVTYSIRRARNYLFVHLKFLVRACICMSIREKGGLSPPSMHSLTLYTNAHCKNPNAKITDGKHMDGSKVI